MSEVDLTVVMVSYNSGTLLRRSLKAIYENFREISFEIIVVDNGSRDNSTKIVRDDFPQAKLIENRENLGFAKANNQVIKRSEARYLLLLNPDTVCKANSPAKMIKFMDNRPEIGILGCKILNADETIQPSNSSFPNLFTEFLRVFQLKRMIPSVKLRKKIGRDWGRLLGLTLAGYFRVYWDSEKTREVDWVTGACLLVRKKAIQEIGPLDENFFMYYEDADWCYRMRQKGWKVLYYPFFEIVHYASRDDVRFNPMVFVERYKSAYYYFQKHGGERPLFLLRLLVCSGLALRCTGLLMKYPFSSVRREELQKRISAYLETIKISGVSG